MKRRAISLALAAVAVMVAVVALGLGASVYYLDTSVPTGQTSTTNAVSLTTSQSDTASSLIQTGSQSTSSQGAQLQITANEVSHSLGGDPVAATCGPGVPGQGASYLEVSNTGATPTVINDISFNFIDMAVVTDSGAPSGACTIAAGATEYITLTGVGMNVAAAGESFGVSVIGNNGGFAAASGTFG